MEIWLFSDAHEKSALSKRDGGTPMVSPKRYGKGWASFRLRILERDRWECQWCGVDLKHYAIRATVDHVTPIELGGQAQDPSNCVASCGTCNSSKSDRARPTTTSIDRLRSSIFPGEACPRGAGSPGSLSKDKQEQQRWKLSPKESEK